MDRALKKAHYTNDLYVGKLEGLSPVSRLKSGFSYVSDADKKATRFQEDVWFSVHDDILNPKNWEFAGIY